MKIKKISKVFIVGLALVMIAVAPEVQVNAAAGSVNEVETRYITGNGVRLRKEGWLGGTILELMYDGEEINYYPDILGSDTEYNYMQRIKTGTYGFVDHHYTRMFK